MADVFVKIWKSPNAKSLTIKHAVDQIVTVMYNTIASQLSNQLEPDAAQTFPAPTERGMIDAIRVDAHHEQQDEEGMSILDMASLSMWTFEEWTSDF